MKDTIIKADWKKRELLMISVCFIIAFFLNIYSIIKFDTAWIELITTLHVTILITLIIYFISIVLRGIYFFIQNIFKNKQKS